MISMTETIKKNWYVFLGVAAVAVSLYFFVL